jgi:translation initiation factor 4B
MEGGVANDVRRNDKSFERRGSPASWGEGREPGAFQAPRQPRPDRPAIPERTPTAADQDSKWREKMRPDAPSPSATPTPDASVPSSPAPPSAPVSRPRLNLAKRTVSEAPKAGETNTSGSDSKASPFGAARPIDTTARDKEIEEKRVAARQKKEEEDKALAEKKAAEKTEKLANMTREPREPKEAKATNVNGNSKQSKPAQGGPDDLDTSAKPRNFQILQRMDGNGDDLAPVDGESGDATMNGNTAEAQSMKPEPVVADAPAVEGTEAAQALEEDGWQTAEKKGKKKSAPRGNNRS